MTRKAFRNWSTYQHLSKGARFMSKKKMKIYLLVLKIHRSIQKIARFRFRTAKDGYRVQQALFISCCRSAGLFPARSQSEIINSRQISHLRKLWLQNGLIQIFLKNGDQTYSSRHILNLSKRKVAIMKTRLKGTLSEGLESFHRSLLLHDCFLFYNQLIYRCTCLLSATSFLNSMSHVSLVCSARTAYQVYHRSYFFRWSRLLPKIWASCAPSSATMAWWFWPLHFWLEILVFPKRKK